MDKSFISKFLRFISQFLARKSVDTKRVSDYLLLMKSYSYTTMVRAMQECDSSYDGNYYIGVLTTGIYCLPSCKAKLPKIENVRFFDSREEAIAFGLRGCKRCKSEKFPDVLPSWLNSIFLFMKDNRDENLNETRLIQLTGADISTVRRYFKDHVGMTPLAFHRKLRLGYARELLQSGQDQFTAALEIGYESSSGFRDAFIKEFGVILSSNNAIG